MKTYSVLSKGYKGKPPINLRLLEETLMKFSQLIIDFPQINEVTINPILLNQKKAVVLDANITIDLDKISEKISLYNHLIIKPYPSKYVIKKKVRGREILFRPIKPEDELLLIDLFKTFSYQTMRFRFFQIIKDISHKTLTRYCNIDYNREICIVAILRDKGKSCAVSMSRLIVEPDGKTGELAIVVGDPWQNMGIGSEMFEYIVQISRDMGLVKIFGECLVENESMLHILRKNNFEVEPIDEETCLATLNLKKNEQRPVSI
jgi:acetyltransferase